MKNMLKRISFMLIVAIVIIANINCVQGATTDFNSSVTYKISTESTTLNEGDMQVLWLRGSDGSYLNPGDWYSYNASKATVNHSGVVTAVADLGSPTTIACWLNGVKYTCVVHVKNKNAPTYEMNVSSTTAYVGGNITPKVYLKGSDGSVVNPDNWYSYNESKATINKNGEITAKPGTAGTSTTVACWQDGVKYTCVVYIKESGPNRTGKQYMLTGEDMYFQLTGFTGTTTFTSSKPNVATINEDGVAHACGAGVTTITMKNGSRTYTCELVVTECRLNVAYKNSNTVQLQRIWEYGPNPGYKRMWNALYNNESTTYTFKSEQQFQDALTYYYNITGDVNLLERNPAYYDGNRNIFIIINPNNDNIAYTHGTKGYLKYYEKAYNDIVNYGITNGMDATTAYKKLVNYVCTNVIYSPAPNYLSEFYSFYTDGHFTCNGYSEMMHILCTMCSIKSTIGNGIAIGGGLHAWNKIYINGTWYNSDICWYDEDYGNYDTYYLLCPTNYKWHNLTQEYVIWRDLYIE